MKLTGSQLRNIIKEELTRVIRLREHASGVNWEDGKRYLNDEGKSMYDNAVRELSQQDYLEAVEGLEERDIEDVLRSLLTKHYPDSVIEALAQVIYNDLN